MSSVSKFVGLGLNALENNFVPLKHPYKLNFSITYWCQSRCLTCNIWQIRPKGELTLEEIRKFAQKNNYFRWIGITGGEPFLRSDIVDIVAAFKQNSKGLYLVTIPTNSLYSKELVANKVEQILNLGVPKLVITLSLDGNREVHDKVRGIKGNFDKVMGMARALRELQKKHKNLFFIFGYTMSKFNQGKLEETYEAVKNELGGITHNDFHINLGQISSIYYNNSSSNIIAERQLVVNELKDFIKKRRMEFGAIPLLESIFLKNLVKFANTGKSPIRSRSLDASLFMDSYGNVYPSIMWSRKIGSIRETDYDLDLIWHSKEAEEIRNEIKNGKEPNSWTSCEAYQSIVGRATSFISLL